MANRSTARAHLHVIMFDCLPEYFKEAVLILKASGVHIQCGQRPVTRGATRPPATDHDRPPIYYEGDIGD